MNIKLRLKTTAIIFFTVTLVLLNAIEASAATSAIYSTLAGISVRAEKSVYPGSSMWSASVGSYANNPIGAIGYAWWTAKEECRNSSGTYVATYQWNAPWGRVNTYSTQLYDAGNFSTHACNSGRWKFWSMGKHDLKQGSSIWQPVFNYPVLYP